MIGMMAGVKKLTLLTSLSDISTERAQPDQGEDLVIWIQKSPYYVRIYYYWISYRTFVTKFSCHVISLVLYPTKAEAQNRHL